MKIVAGRELGWAAAQYRHHVALVFGEVTYSYGHLDRRVNQLANGLRDGHVKTGDRVAVLLNNSVESVETVLAASKAAFVHVALNARHTPEEQAGILRDCGATTLIVGAEFRGMMERLRELAPALRSIIGVGWEAPGVVGYDTLLAQSADTTPCVEIDDGAVSRIAYTSGTTGKPKGIVYTYARYSQRINNFFAALEYRLDVEDSIIHVGPLSHAAGNYLIPYYLRGARNIVAPRFDPATMLELIERERVTHLFLVPMMLTRLLDHLDSSERRYDLSSLRRINYGTAPTPEGDLRRGIRRFGPIFRQHLGMSECPQPLTVLYPREHVLEGDPKLVRRLASCGRPTVNVDITIRDDKGGELPGGEIGEIAIAAQGIGDVAYWNRPDLRAEVVRDGWFYTGDRGWFDDDGYLFIAGRNKDMIISGGFNIYSREVEVALECHAEVFEAAVIGVPDPEWGESVVAFVVPRQGSRPSEADIIAHCREHIASYKKPRHVRFLEALPRNNAGKLDRQALRDSCASK
ncbi:MAG: AMP-binding protein [Aquisalimonadaceae bacterium]